MNFTHNIFGTSAASTIHEQQAQMMAQMQIPSSMVMGIEADYEWVADKPDTQIAVEAGNQIMSKIEEFNKAFKCFDELKSMMSGVKKGNALSDPKFKMAMERCLNLKESFRIVKKDDGLLRNIPINRKKKGSETLSVPLVWSCELPASPTKTMTINIGPISNHSVTAMTPPPTKEAIEQMKKHSDKFDKLEVWWVPNDLVVKKIPDPVLVGRIDFPGVGEVYFELHRWIDETVESGYWSREGY